LAFPSSKASENSEVEKPPKRKYEEEGDLKIKGGSLHTRNKQEKLGLSIGATQEGKFERKEKKVASKGSTDKKSRSNGNKGWPLGRRRDK